MQVKEFYIRIETHENFGVGALELEQMLYQMLNHAGWIDLYENEDITVGLMQNYIPSPTGEGDKNRKQSTGGSEI